MSDLQYIKSRLGDLSSQAEELANLIKYLLQIKEQFADFSRHVADYKMFHEASDKKLGDYYARMDAVISEAQNLFQNIKAEIAQMADHVESRFNTFESGTRDEVRNALDRHRSEYLELISLQGNDLRNEISRVTQESQETRRDMLSELEQSNLKLTTRMNEHVRNLERGLGRAVENSARIRQELLSGIEQSSQLLMTHVNERFGSIEHELNQSIEKSGRIRLELLSGIEKSSQLVTTYVNERFGSIERELNQSIEKSEHIRQELLSGIEQTNRVLTAHINKSIESLESNLHKSLESLTSKVKISLVIGAAALIGILILATYVLIKS